MLTALLAHIDQPRGHIIHIEEVALWTLIPFVIVLLAVAYWVTAWILRSPDKR